MSLQSRSHLNNLLSGATSYASAAASAMSTSSSSASSSTSVASFASSSSSRRPRPVWMTVIHRLMKQKLMAARANVRHALVQTDFNVDAAVRYLIDNKLTTELAKGPGAAGGLHAKRGRDSAGSDSAFKKNRGNDNLGSDAMSLLLAGLGAQVRSAVRVTLDESRPSNWAGTVADMLGASGDATREETVAFLLRVGAALENVPESREKVSCLVPVYDMLSQMHNVDVELNHKVEVLLAGAQGSSAVPTDPPPAFCDAVDKFAANVSSLMKLYGLVYTKVKRLNSRGKEIAEKFRIQLKQKIMAQNRVVRACKSGVESCRQRLQQVDAQILPTNDNDAKFSRGDRVLAKATIPGLDTVAFIPAVVRDVDTNLLRVQVQYASSGDKPGKIDWIPQEDVQAQSDDAAELRRRSELFKEVQNPEKQSLLRDRQRAQTDVAAAEEKLRIAEAKFSINDESRKVADNILIKEDSYSAQTFVLDVPKLERTLALLHDATGAIRQSFTALAQIQIERRTHSVAQVESEQHKLETQRRLYPTMTRQIEQMELNVRDWQDMTRKCATNDVLVMKTVLSLLEAIASAPQWVVEAAFSSDFQAETRSLKATVRSGVLNRDVVNRIDQFLSGLQSSRLWASGARLEDLARRAVNQHAGAPSEEEAVKLKAVKARLAATGLGLNRRISIWWADDKRAYDGVLIKPSTFAADGLLQVNYDDGDVRRYSLDNLILRAQRVLPAPDFIAAELQRHGVTAKIGQTIKAFSWIDKRVVDVRVQLPTSGELDRVKPIVAVVRQDTGKTSNLEIPHLARLIKTANAVPGIVGQLKSHGVTLGEQCELWSFTDRSIRRGTVELNRVAFENEKKVSFIEAESGAIQHFNISELLAAVTQAGVHRRQSSVSASALNAQLRAAGIPAAMGDTVIVWSTNNGGEMVSGKLVSGPNGSFRVVDTEGKVVVDCNLESFRRVLSVARRYEQDMEFFGSLEHLAGFIVPRRSLQVFSPVHKRVVAAELQVASYAANDCRYTLRFFDGTTLEATARDVAKYVERAGAVVVDRGLAANGLSAISAVAGTPTELWGGAARGILRGVLRAGFKPDGTVRVMLVDAKSVSDSTPSGLFLCGIDELVARLKQAQKFRAGQVALSARNLRIGGPITVWWGGDKRSYTGTLQLETNFDTSGKLTVRYDDGDIRHYDVQTLMKRVDEARSNMEVSSSPPAAVAVPRADSSSSSPSSSSQASADSFIDLSSASPAAGEGEASRDKFQEAASRAIQELQNRQRGAADAAAEEGVEKSGCVVM